MRETEEKKGRKVNRDRMKQRIREGKEGKETGKKQVGRKWFWEERKRESKHSA